MARESKYIFGSMTTCLLNSEGAVIFPAACDHKQMANRICLPDTVTSAGFVSLIPDVDSPGGIRVELYGESRSLKLQANPQHTNAVRRALGLPTD